MTCVGSSDFHAHLGRRKFDFVVEDHEISPIDLEEIRRFLNRPAGFVHERFRAKQHNLFLVEGAFRRHALKAAAPGCETMTPCNFVDGHKADVVTIMRILCAGIAETNKEAHDPASSAGKIRSA
jgi:hypothetical protein